MMRSNAATNPLCRHRMWRERSTIAAFGLVAASWSARWSAGPPQWVTTAEKTEPDWVADGPAGGPLAGRRLGITR
jgi:hypothetical protein